MMITKEVSVDLYEKYNKVLKLIEDSKLDPGIGPSESAKQILLDMETNLENLSKSPSIHSAEALRVTAMLGAVYLYLGMVSIDTEDMKTGEKYLQKCHDTIKDYHKSSEMVMVSLNMYNQFGILWSQKEPNKSKTYLEQAEKLYYDFKSPDTTPVDIHDLFCPTSDKKGDDCAKKNFEKIHTFTLYYLAQIYGALKEALKSAVYCHNTLQRQLDCSDYDPIDWALNAATLSQFFMEKDGFKQARHHLAASSHVLDQYEKELNAQTERDESWNAKMENFKHRSADVARCWAKYGLLILTKSKERLLRHTDDIDKNCSIASDLSHMSLDPDESVTLEDLQNLDFVSLNLTQYEMQITDKYILTLQDARLVFLNIQTWLQKAEGYYTLEALASDHIEIVEDKSQMYLNLLFFDDDVDNQAKLHKRRIDLLENLIKNINPQYYLSYCRQIWFELAQIYADTLNIKCDKLRESEDRPSPHVLTKINHLTERGIYNYNCFINSFAKNNSEMPTKIPDDFEKAFLQARFYVGVLSSKFITLDKGAQLRNTEASHKAYKDVVEYCEANEKARELIPMEYNICKEMASLLPVKIAKLTQELG